MLFNDSSGVAGPFTRSSAAVVRALAVPIIAIGLLLSVLVAPPADAVTALTSSASAVSGVVGTAITPVTMSADASGGTLAFTASALPSGLVIDPATGTISGVPGVGGVTTAVVTATETAADASTTTATASVEFTIAALTASTSTLLATTGVPITALSLTGVAFTPTTFALSGCTLPVGLALDSATGVIAGTAENPFTGTCTVTGTDGTVAASVDIPTTVKGPAFALPMQTVQGLVGTDMTSTAFGASGFFGTLNYSVDATGPALPAGFALDPITGIVSVTMADSLVSVPPTTVIIRATDSAATPNTLTASVRIIVDDATVAPASQSLVGLVGAPIVKTKPLIVTGLAASPTFTSALPAGLAIDPVTGVVSGTPVAVSAAATYPLVATDSAGKVATSLLELTVHSPAGPGQVVKGTVGRPVVTDILTPAVAAGSTPQQSYAITPDLPTGLAIDQETGAVTGTPTQAISKTIFVITKSDISVPAVYVGATTLTLTIAGTLAPAKQSIVGEIGTALTSVRLFPTGLTSPVTMTIEPAIPGELTFNASTGILSGVPVDMYPTSTYTVTATDVDGAVATASLTLTVTKVELLKPVIGAVKGGAAAGSLVVFFAKPFFTPDGHVFIVEMRNATGDLVATKSTTASPVTFTGLIPGATYTAIVISPETGTYLRVQSLPVSGVATAGKPAEDIVFSAPVLAATGFRPLAATAGWRDARVQLATATQARKARVLILKKRPSRVLAGSPSVRVPARVVVRVSVPWSGSKAVQDVHIRSGRIWLRLGAVRPSGGRLITPAFRIVKTGTYPVLIGTSGSVASFFKATSSTRGRASQ